MKFISGWKTHIVAIGTVLAAVGGFMAGTVDAATALQMVFGALGLSALRDGIAKK